MQSWHVGHEVDNQSQEEELIDDTILTKNVSRILQSWHVLCVMRSMASLWQMAIFQLEHFWQENLAIILKESNMQVHKI